jgi:aspartyl-tRNA(Asn)/glutamyl-tRNA(Gln) amidotransferase subunit A
MRVGWTARLGNAVVARDVEAALERFVATLARLGARVEPLGEAFESTEPVWRVINHSTWAARFRPLVAAHEAVMSPTLVRQVREAEVFSAVELQQAAFARTRIFRNVQRWFERFDLVVTPTLSRAALPVDGDLFAPIEIDGVATDTVRRAWYPYTLPFNLTGHPAVSMPAGADADGLPIGVQLVGGFRRDGELLSACATVEAALPELPWPPLALQ